VSAGHFFVGLGAGLAILTIPVALLNPALPQHIEGWINGSPPDAASLTTTQSAAVTRPLSGYKPGDPTPTVEAPPLIQARVTPTAEPAARPAVVPSGPAPQLADLRWAGTGVIHSGGIPVYVRKVAGVDSLDDPLIADGSPVLVSSTPPLQIGSQQWRAIRGLNGVIGWVPSYQVAVDGEPPPQPLLVAVGPTPTVQPSASTTGPQSGLIANTDGAGVVLRNSPNDADRERAGLMDGAHVVVLEWSGTDWLHVRADNGLTGWVPAQYVIPAG